jgi:membrane associated rhomboid family serine protease
MLRTISFSRKNTERTTLVFVVKNPLCTTFPQPAMERLSMRMRHTTCGMQRNSQAFRFSLACLATPRTPPLPSRRSTPRPTALDAHNNKRDPLEEPLQRIDAVSGEVHRLLGKYAGGGDNRSSSPLQRQRQLKTQSSNSAGGGMGDGVFYLLVINFALHTANYFWHPAWLGALPLAHWAPRWWQFVTAAFVHANWEHLLSNAFSLLVFGRMVEEEEGALGVWLTYLVCGVGGNLASYLTAPAVRAVSLGASSAVFGLFVVGVVSKLRPSAKRLLEAAILGSFVVRQVLQEVSMVSAGKGAALASSAAAGGTTVGHWAHLGGAAAGVLLVLLLSRLPAADM